MAGQNSQLQLPVKPRLQGAGGPPELGSSPALLLKPEGLPQLQAPPALQDPTVQAGHMVEVGLLRRGKRELLAQVKPFR